MHVNPLAIRRLQDQLGHSFGDDTVLMQALTHTSYGHEHHPEAPVALRDNERLEFLGDAILDAVVTDILLERFADADEGHLSRLRAAIVC